MKRFLSIIMTFLLLFIYINSKTYAAEWPAGPSLVSGAAIVMDASTGTVLYGYNENEKNYPASITKVLTTLIALEKASLTDVITFSHDAVYNIDSGSTHIGINEGEQITMEDALHAVMLASANEVSNGVAESVAGTNEAFSEMMNAKAKELGCTGSNFINPHGLHNADHYTTCYDMALICCAALKNETFRKITSTTSYTIPATNLTDESRGFYNHQQMLSGNKYPQYKYEGCIGGKTGYTNSASNTLVSFAERNGRTLVTVVMNSDFNGQYTDSIALMNYGFNNFKNLSVTENETSNKVKDELSLFQRYFELSNEDSAYIYVEEGSSITLPTDAEYSEASKEVTFFDNVTLQDGSNIVGEISYTLNERVVGKHSIIMNKYKSSSLPTITLPEEVKNYSIVVNGEASGSAVAKLKPSLLDAVFIAGCLLVVMIIFLIIKALSRKSRRRRAYRSRRRHSQNYWDDLDF